MDKEMRVEAIIAAAGAGKRIGGRLSKQFLLLSGEPILKLTLLPFERCSLISKIILVVPRRRILLVKGMVKDWGYRKVRKIVSGGKERQDSILNGLKALSLGTKIVVIHDGVRPFITENLIRKTVQAAAMHKAVVTGLPVKETIKNVEKGFITSTFNRERVWSIQTPQAFEVNLLKRAYKQAYQDSFYGTDDAALVERIGFKVKVIKGSEENIKITTLGDLRLAKAIHSSSLGFREGFGYDLHPLVEGRPLILGGVKIPFKRGALGDSDADVLTHAIIDALLGAVGEGDIGTHFPPGDPQYEGIKSLTLLPKIFPLIERRGFKVENIDTTIVLEAPKIGNYVTKMKRNLCPLLKIDSTQLNIKATTAKGLGEIGQGQAIACYAVVILSARVN